MKNNYLLMLLICALIFQCNTTINAQNIDNSEIELVLIEKGENFVWEKGRDLNLKCKLINKSQQVLTIIQPKRSRSFRPDLFEIVLSEDFRGNLCEFEVGLDEFANTKDFQNINPGEEKEFMLIGRNYYLNYCNDAKTTKDSIKVYLLYKGKNYEYNNDSYYIKTNYKSFLSEEEEENIKTQVESRINRSYSNLNEEEKEKKRTIFRDYLKKGKIKCTPEEQELIIKLYNNSYPKLIKSNVISIKIEI